MKGLASQMRNMAIFIPSNIAEARTRKPRKKALQYFVVARGFLNKLDTHVECSHALGFIDTNNYRYLETQIQSIDSLLARLVQSRKTKIR
jgi:four helix bundle protein